MQLIQLKSVVSGHHGHNEIKATDVEVETGQINKPHVNKPHILKLLIPLTLILGLVAGCHDSGSDSASASAAGASEPTSEVITGGGVKGPLANAIVTVYSYDPGQTDFKGFVVASAMTDNRAAISGLALPFPISPPYFLEFTSDAGTTDITTGLAPVISTLRTVITQTLLDSGEQIYATPLTTMAVDIAISHSGEETTAEEFEAALKEAASQVVSTVGFGIAADIDIFDTPPLVDSTTDTSEELSDVASYRSAVEALTAVVYEMEQQSTGDVDTVLGELSADLVDGAIDGIVDGNVSTVFTSSTLDILAQDPSKLVIPNTTQTVADVQDILIAETLTTGSTTETTELGSGGSISTTTEPAVTNPDIDGDGTLNVDDVFPEDATEDTDTDRDGIGDNADTDDDNDGILDVDEGLTAETSSADTDGDGFDDEVDNCPANFNPAQTNTDRFDDGGDACDIDDDNDEIPDSADAFPLDGHEHSDADGDGIGDHADTDDDNDGIDDGTEAESGNSVDHDEDGVPNSQDNDSDNDGVLDNVDYDPYDDEVTFNLAPVTTDSSVSTEEDVPVEVVLEVKDDGVAEGKWSYKATGPEHGELSGTVPNLIYTPNPEFSGSDSFTYVVFDGGEKVSNRSTVRITVTVINDAPVIEQEGPLTVQMDEDGLPTAFLAPTITATDVDSSTLIWSGTAANHGRATVSGTGASPKISYVPNEDFSGVDSFDVIVSDDADGADGIDGTDGINGVDTFNGDDVHPGGNRITINVFVNAQNDAPVIAQEGPLTVLMDEDGSPLAFAAPTITASDIDSDTLIWSGTAARHGRATVSGTGASPIIGYEPNENFNGNDSFEVMVSDGLERRDDISSAGRDSITINVTISSQDDLPTIGGTPSGTVIEGESYSFKPTASDADGDALSFSIQNQPSWSTASFNSVDGSFSGTPGAKDVGGDFSNIIISVTAGGQTVSLAPFGITVTEAPPDPAVWDQFNWDDGSIWQEEANRF